MLERVQKIISNSGFCSRRKAEEFIERRKVSVNGKIIKLGDKADIDTDKICVGDFEIEKIKPTYIMLNKPKGYEVTLSPDVRRSVANLIPAGERLFPVGRLDKNTTGLLLFTNDGNFANKVTHPRYEKDKTYLAKLDKRIEDRDIREIEKGMRLKDGYIQGKVRLRSHDEVEVTIHEGKKWIIKRMFFKLGYYVKSLTRVRIGNIYLDVKEGRWRHLKQREVDELLK